MITQNQKWEAAIMGELIGKAYFENVIKSKRNAYYINDDMAALILKRTQIELERIIPDVFRPIIIKAIKVGVMSAALNSKEAA